MNIAGALTRKYGPLELWKWLGLLAVVMVALRRFRKPSSSATADTTLGDNGAAAGTGFGRFGAGGDGSGLIPTDQTIADPGLSGPGTPVVYDPLTGGTTPVGREEPAPKRYPAEPSPPSPAGTVTSLRPRGKETTPAETGRALGKKIAAAALAASPAIKTRPASSRGTRAAVARAPELISEHGAGQMTHPPAAANKPAPATRTTQTATPPVIERPRAAATTVVDAGARASTVGTTTVAKTAVSMGRKMETG